MILKSWIFCQFGEMLITGVKLFYLLGGKGNGGSGI